MTKNDNLQARREELLTTLRDGIQSQLSEEHQNEISKLMDVLPDLSRPGCEDLIGAAEVAAKNLLLAPPNLSLATQIRSNLKARVRRFRNPIFGILRGGSPASVVILGLGALLYFGIPLSYIIGRRLLDVPIICGVESQLVTLVAGFGALGSIVSIMVRIHDFAGLKTVDSSVLFFTGFFKPVIGTSFALFVFALINSGIFPILIEHEKSQFFYIALSFVAGFSERFAQDIVRKTEEAVVK